MSHVDEEKCAHIEAYANEALKEGNQEKLGALRLVCAIGLIRSSKLPVQQLSDFGTASILAYRSSVQIDLLEHLLDIAAKTKVPMEVVVSLMALKVIDKDAGYQNRVLTLTELFVDEAHEKDVAHG